MTVLKLTKSYRECLTYFRQKFSISHFISTEIRKKLYPFLEILLSSSYDLSVKIKKKKLTMYIP